MPGPPYAGPPSKPILDSVKYPSDMKRLNMRELKQVCATQGTVGVVIIVSMGGLSSCFLLACERGPMGGIGVGFQDGWSLELVVGCYGIDCCPPLCVRHA